MEEIRLQKSIWFYDPTQQLGPAGGFGVVFTGQSATGQRVAIKQLKIDADASAHRELRVASLFENQYTSNVIPIHDSGEDANSGRYFVVMALADKSLQTDMNAGWKFSIAESVDTLQQIANGLSELKGLVHRDLKPGNLLLHEGKWKIADFGIARFVEESTSLNTLEGCLSPAYAAPEQWRLEKVEVATDLYALGCIAYALVSGAPPFAGPRLEHYRDQHLNKTPSELPVETPDKLRILISMLLRKSPDARPRLGRVMELLKKLEQEESAPRPPSAISAAAARLEQKRAQEESVAAELRTKELARDGLAESGKAILVGIMADLRKNIVEDAPTCEHDGSPEVTLGNAQISLYTTLRALGTVPEGAFPNSKIDVVLALPFRLVQFIPRYRWESALLYCKMPRSEDYRWYEASFMHSPLSRQHGMDPFSLLEAVNDAPYRFYHPDMAIGPGVHSYQVAFGPRSIDDEDEAEFIERWTTMFAAAAEGRLKYPSRLPLSEDYWKNLRVYGM
jgi:serine/threonine protein kinase